MLCTGCRTRTTNKTDAREVKIYYSYKKELVLIHARGVRVLLAAFTTGLIQRVGPSATTAQAAMQVPSAALHAMRAGGTAGSATPNVAPAPA
jgi:hypothetical protein